MSMMSSSETQEALPRAVYVLLLLAADKGAPVAGRTRLEKLVFLIQEKILQELRLVVSEDVYHFRPLHFGPFSEEVLDDLRTLKMLGLAGVDGEDKAEQVFRITDKGHVAAQRILETGRVPRVLMDKIERIKVDFGRLSLDELIREVYREFPQYIEQSHIKDKYLY